MKPATRMTSKRQVVIPKLVRLTPLKTEDSIDILYGCLKDLPGCPVAELESEHRAEIEADERWQRRGR